MPVTAAVQRAVYERAAVLPLSAFEQETYYTKLETAQQVDGDRLSDLLENFTWVLSSVVGVAGLMALYVRAHWLLAVVLVATVALHALVESTMSRVSVEARYRNSPRRRERSYWVRSALQPRCCSGATSVSAGRSTARALAPCSQTLRCRGSDRPTQDGARQSRQRCRPGSHRAGHGNCPPVARVGARASVWVTWWRCSMGWAAFENSPATSATGYRICSSIGGNWGHLRAFLALEGERLPLRTPRRGLPRPLREGVRFRDVSFTYPGSSRPAVDGVTLTLRPQERVALVGENGAGKTTLVRLLLGLYRPTHGAITVDGIDLAEIDPDEWRREATAVFQDFVRYPDHRAREHLLWRRCRAGGRCRRDWGSTPANHGRGGAERRGPIHCNAARRV